MGNGQQATGSRKMTIRSYRDLKVWQLAMNLAEAAYRLAQTMPATEIYGLTSQIRRSAASVPANIAEGYGRESAGSYVHFLKTARGSLRELETHILLAQRVGAVAQAESDALLAKADDIGKMLWALIKAVKARGPATP
jgi:four helix bundle protein